MQNKIIKEQFNKQADNFANWCVGRNVEYLQAYFDFCGIQPGDTVLDVACGPGEFTVFMARRVLKARGVDISDKEIDIANGLANKFGLGNIAFDCADVEKLTYPNNSYSVVVCKSAFHHFPFPEVVFKEMIRCCESKGRVSIQDIVAYKDTHVNNFFEKFDKLVDISHNKSLTQSGFNKLFRENKIEKTGEFRLSVDLNVDEYLQHAQQSDENKIKINELLETGKNDKKLSEYLFNRDGGLYFKRSVFLIIGRKG